jgi:hypothetical protein
LALPLFLLLAAPLRADMMDSASESPSIDATVMLLRAKPEALDDISSSLGFPTTGAQFVLYGGGETFAKGPLRVGVQGLLGGLSSTSGDLNTSWNLRLGNIVLEQRYPLGDFLVAAGSTLTYAQLEGLFSEANSKVTRYDGQAFGAGVEGAVRWPRLTKLGFLLRAGYQFLPVSGNWSGDRSGLNPRSSIDLGGPFGQAQLELGF